MNQEEFLQKRDQWLKEVSDQCHEFASKDESYPDFYVFQTPCDKYNPDLLIIGINPGGGRPYTEMLKKKGYTKRPSTDLGYDTNTLVTKPQWEKEKGNDAMRSAFSRVFTDENKLKKTLEEAVMMNMCYFNTLTEKDMKSIPDELINYCRTKTLEFIEILNPKNILFLTSQDSNLKKCGVSNIQGIDNNVKRGKLTNKDVFVIPHYGYHGAYSFAKGAEMGKTLRKAFDQINIKS